ncbi:phage-related hypothetical protein [Bordetella bronchiseptica RB50]|uniref:Uncharacterized protein n=1 Tax=Bordetella bronchiseptica (strain ATCC BAA-588 / NCTC 13252 / RB50) TaxID=257310 RepID=A0A0H3LPQ8_BORBR|nr:phage-related hypothetical protein [Bordetella bronchiseptica]CAE34019.1 phage-related hypothetical protein [Bordetella bronchiseptica RB50]
MLPHSQRPPSCLGVRSDPMPGLMRNTLYRNRHRLQGYGLKFWCNERQEVERVLAVCTSQDP